METEKLIKTSLSFYALGDFRRYVRLKHGFANRNFKLITGGGLFLFRIQMQSSLQNIEKEHRMLELLRKSGFPAAFPVPDKNGNTWHTVNGTTISIYDFIPGEVPPLNSQTVTEAAVVLARLHQTEAMEIPFKPNKLRPQKVYSIMEKFARAPHPLPDVFDRVSRVWETLEPFLHEKLPSGLIHADLFPDNTIFEGNRLKAVIDFEDYCIDSLLFDVAMSINGFCFVHNRLDPVLFNIFLKTYDSRRPLTPEEKALLPVYIRWTALAMTSWHLENHLMYKPYPRQEKRVRELLERAENQYPIFKGQTFC